MQSDTSSFDFIWIKVSFPEHASEKPVSITQRDDDGRWRRKTMNQWSKDVGGCHIEMGIVLTGFSVVTKFKFVNNWPLMPS